MQRRKPLVVAGYSFSGMMRPLIGLAGSWPMVLGLRFADRVGKGVRTSPRDALIADVTDESARGAAYGFHRAMDHAGAVLGPLVAAVLLNAAGMPLRQVFLLSSIPALFAVLVVVFGVKELARPAVSLDRVGTGIAPWSSLGKDYRRLLLAVAVFTLGNSTDAFLLLRLSGVGVPASGIALLWSAHHVVKMVASYYGGRLSDRVGPRAMILGGWLFYAAVYLLFGGLSSQTWLIVVFLAYGIYFGLAEPSERAWVASLVPADLRGTAFGWYHGVVGLAALPASLVFGLLWQQFGAPLAFMIGGILALVAALLLLRVHDSKGDSR